MRRLLALLTALLLASCTEPVQQGPLAVAVIGPAPRLAPIGRDPPSPGQALLLRSAAQGLVQLDAAGQVEPGLAERWIVTDDGLSYIFRLRRAEWRPGRPVTARQVAQLLAPMLRENGRNRLARYFSAVEKVEAVTDSIIEVRLRAPRPHFLALLATPELAILSRGAGTGPYRAAAEAGGLALTPVIDPIAPETAAAFEPLTLMSGRAAMALALYREARVDAVLGGTLADIEVARAARLPQGQLRFDPAVGLFGLAVTAREGLLASAENREALSMAIDRDAIVALARVGGWSPVTAISPARFDLPQPPAQPEWTALARPGRLAIARARIEAWRSNNDAEPRVRVALPEGPGMRLLFALVAADFAAIGVAAERVASNAPAELVLIDEVAPNDSATWALTRLSCGSGLPCGETGERALAASRLAPTLAERSALLAAADAAFTVNTPFIPIASPVRWSAVRPRLTGFRANPRAVHPLNHLLRE